MGFWDRNWGGVLVIAGNIVEFFSLEVNERIPHWLKGLKSPRRLISFFELLGTYIGIRLCAPNRLKGDLTWLGIPAVADNLRNDFILRKTLYVKKANTSGVTRIIGPYSNDKYRNYPRSRER